MFLNWNMGEQAITHTTPGSKAGHAPCNKCACNVAETHYGRKCVVVFRASI